MSCALDRASAGGEPCGARRRVKFGIAGPIARRDDELAALPLTLAFRRAVEAVGVEFIAENCGGPGVRMKAMSPASDQALIAVLDADEIWIIRHDGADHANSLRRALQKAADLATAGHHVSSIRNLGDRTIIEPDQIIRLFKHIGQA
jgi:hypothetical protein